MGALHDCFILGFSFLSNYAAFWSLFALLLTHIALELYGIYIKFARILRSLLIRRI